MVHILAHHEIMPTFLDFCFEFQNRGGNPRVTTMFRAEDSFSDDDISHGVLAHHRSDLRIQHAFTMLAHEFVQADDPDARQPGHEWPLRNVTVYHSFDVEQAKSLWIIIKGDNKMELRVMGDEELYTRAYSDNTAESNNGLDISHARNDVFDATLRTHCLLVQWCTETWAEYVSHLDSDANEHDAAIMAFPVEDVAESMAKLAAATHRKKPMRQEAPPAKPKVLDRVRSFASSRRGTGLSHRRRNTLPKVVEIDQDEKAIHIAGDPVDESSESQDNPLDMENYFTPSNLQRLFTLVSEVENASAIIKQDKKILDKLSSRYELLASSPSFTRHFNQKKCQSSVTAFQQQIKDMECDLDVQALRLEALLMRLCRTREAVCNAMGGSYDITQSAEG